MAAIGDVFEEMLKHFCRESARGVIASFQFEITGADGGVWVFVVSAGECELVKEAVDNPTVVIRLSAADWIAIRSGRLNSQQAFMQGRLEIAGDMNVAMQLQRLFPMDDSVSAHDPPPEQSDRATIEDADGSSTESEEVTKADAPSPIGLVFEEMLGHFDALGATGIRASYQFELSGETGGIWTFQINENECNLLKGGVSRPDVTICISDQDWLAIRRGRTDSSRLFSEGRLQIRGDMILAMKLKALFPIGDRSSHSRPLTPVQRSDAVTITGRISPKRLRELAEGLLETDGQPESD